METSRDHWRPVETTGDQRCLCRSDVVFSGGQASKGEAEAQGLSSSEEEEEVKRGGREKEG